MNDMMGKVKSGLADIGKKTGQTYEIGKLKMAIKKHKSTIEKETMKMGQAVLEHSQRGMTRVELTMDPFDLSLQEIRILTRKIADMEAQISTLRIEG